VSHYAALQNSTAIQETLKTGVFSHCSLWHTDLLEIRNITSYSQKTWFLKVLIFLCPKCSKTHPRASLIPKKNFRQLYSRAPVKRGSGEGRVASWLLGGMDAPFVDLLKTKTKLLKI